MTVTATEWLLRFLSAAQSPPPAPRLRGRAANVDEWWDTFLQAAVRSDVVAQDSERTADEQVDNGTESDSATVTGTVDQSTSSPAGRVQEKPRLKYRQVGGDDDE